MLSLFASMLFAVGGCASDTSVDPILPDTTNTGGGGGTLQKASLTVHVTVAVEDTAIAGLIGSSGGVLRDAEVSIERSGSSSSRQTARADANGNANFANLLPGGYNVSVIRLLTPGEVAQLGTTNGDITAFGGGASIAVAAPSTGATVQAIAGRRGSLVISELLVTLPRLPDGNSYFFAHFVEVYNNSDSTIYLDGKVISRSLGHVHDYPDFSCAKMERWRNDPDGIWTKWIYAFPGAGNSHPLAPGDAVVVATDAIDHRQYVPSLADLSSAEFEFLGPSDVDNPNAANMVNIGPREWAVPVSGHGLDLSFVPVLILANPLDPASLLRENTPLLDPEYWRIPRDKILDVFSSASVPTEESASGYALCRENVNAIFDSQRANLISELGLYGIQRRVLSALPDGRKILQRTKTSVRDFEAGAITPGSIP